MAENYEYESILQQMLDMQPADVDKREGSIIYNTCAAAAFVIAQQAYMIGYMFNLLYPDTAEDEWLDRGCADFGVTREPATYSIRQINTLDSTGTAMDCTIGDRFAINDLTFALTTKIATGQYQATCEQLGAQGNSYSGTILPIDNISGLGSATLVSTPLIPATDVESDDALRAKFYAYVRQVPYGGNIADYEEKTLAITGVGAVKVFNATTMGVGQVGIVIGDDNGNKATSTLVTAVQTLMGVDGSGIAPIGHTVTVGTSTDLTVNVAAGIKIKSGANFTAVQKIVTQIITDYINNIGFNDSTVFYAKLVAAILNCSDSITDVGTVTINSASTNLSLTKTFANYQVPILGTVTVTNAT